MWEVKGEGEGTDRGMWKIPSKRLREMGLTEERGKYHQNVFFFKICIKYPVNPVILCA